MNRRDRRVLCSYCLHASVPAVKQCLPCEAVLCQNHLKVHSRSADHVLVDIATSPAIRRCPQHNVGFSSYCPSCKACLCPRCKTHFFHNPLNLSNASEIKKTRLQQVLMTLVAKMQSIPDQIKQLESAKEELSQKICDVTCLVNAEDPLTVLQERESERRDFCDMEQVESERTIRELQEENREMMKKFMVAVVIALCLLGMLFLMIVEFFKLLFKCV